MANLGTMFENLKTVVNDTLKDSIKMINISDLHESADNFFSINNVEELAQTILGQGGVKENLIVKPLESGGYEIISGHRRKAAVEYLIEKGENVSHNLPCLVQKYDNEEDKMLDLIMMNVSARQLSDSEMWQSYEKIDKIIQSKKEKGTYFGRVRDEIAQRLGVSNAQVGKMQNISNNAIADIIEAITNGDISIHAANELAKLDKDQQEQLVSDGIEFLTAADIKKKTKKSDVATNSNAKSAKSGNSNSKKNKSQSKKGRDETVAPELIDAVSLVISAIQNGDFPKLPVEWLRKVDEICSTEYAEDNRNCIKK